MRRQHSTPALAHNHKKRVEGFIVSAIDKPVPVSQYRNDPPCFRQTSTEGLLGSKGFYIRRESQSQRIDVTFWFILRAPSKAIASSTKYPSTTPSAISSGNPPRKDSNTNLSLKV